MNKYETNMYTKVDDLSLDDIKRRRKKVKEDIFNYPKYHIAPKYGLLNDPNGLVYFQGEYHIFYQWCPNGPYHGMKSWYHLTTKDFINYKDRKIAIKASEYYDNYGIYSGGAKVVGDKLYLFYTGNRRDENNGFKREPHQCVAIMNKNYEIEEKKILIKPDENFTEHFRDPVNFTVDDEEFIILGAQNHQNKGEIVVYKTNSDFTTFSEGKTLKHHMDLKDTFMIECPTITNFDEQAALIFSPQGLKSDSKYEYNNIYDVVYSISKCMDIKKGVWNSKEFFQLDYGFDFYAPQVFKDHQNRNILIGWLGQAADPYPKDEVYEWSEQLTIPRQLFLKNSKLYQKPLRELEGLRINSLPLAKSNKVNFKSFELNLTLTKDFKIQIGNEKYNLKISGINNEIIIDRSENQYLVNEKFGLKRYIPLKESLNVSLQIFVDFSSMEVFINDGETVASLRYFIDEVDRIDIVNLIEGTIHQLNKINYT